MTDYRPDRLIRPNYDWPTPWEVELHLAETKWLVIGCILGCLVTLLVGAAL